MTLNVAMQMDPMEGINIGGDSTFAIMLAAQGRGHALWHYRPCRIHTTSTSRPRSSRTGSPKEKWSPATRCTVTGRALALSA